MKKQNIFKFALMASWQGLFNILERKGGLYTWGPLRAMLNKSRAPLETPSENQTYVSEKVCLFLHNNHYSITWMNTKVKHAVSCSTFAIVIKLLSLWPFVMVLLMFIFKKNPSVKYFLFLFFVFPFKAYPEVMFVAMWYNAYGKMSQLCAKLNPPKRRKIFV